MKIEYYNWRMAMKGVKAGEFSFIGWGGIGDNRQNNLKGHNFWLYSPHR